MLWLIVAILAYLISAVVFLVDKYLLVNSIPNPKVYSFYVGILGIAVLSLLPFIEFSVLTPPYLVFAFIAGASFVLAILWFFKGLGLYEPSRIVPAVGGILPVFTFLLIFILSKGKEALSFWEIISLLLLILGSFLITYERAKKFSPESLKISAIAAFFFAFSFVFSKYVYLEYPFLLGLVWIRLGGVAMALIFLFSRRLRDELFKEKPGFEKKTAVVFFSGQAAGAGAGILQNWAVALVPLAYVAFVNALQGVQYAFLLIFAVLLSSTFPKILKEEISREVILQKITAVIIIGAGLTILAL